VLSEETNEEKMQVMNPRPLEQKELAPPPGKRMAHRARPAALLLSGALASLVTLTAPAAHADTSVIKYPGLHPDYAVELEPHLIVGPLPLPGPGRDRPGVGFGPGVRATFEIVDNGFIKTINNTVGIGVGADLAIGDRTGVWVPVVMQWNFFLSENWSVFGEPGAGLWIGRDVFPSPTFYAGGRYHFARNMTLTMRVGYPMLSVGLSFLL
jgi:hypothetical protein